MTVNADEALLAHPTLTSCCVAWGLRIPALEGAGLPAAHALAIGHALVSGM